MVSRFLSFPFFFKSLSCLPHLHSPYACQILAIEMHRGLRPLGAGQGPLGDGNDGVGNGTGKVSTEGGGRGGGAEGSKAAAEAVEGFIRKNIEAYFGCWTSTYTLFSLNPRLVSKMNL